jgi:alpha-tubulin suppressor-like RCC1 family protein
MYRKVIPGLTLSVLGHSYLTYDSSGSLYVWGSNRFGQLGLGHTQQVSTPLQTETFEQIAAKGFVSCGLREGRVFVWGRNKLDIFNLESQDNVALPLEIAKAEQVALGYNHMGIVKDNTIFLWGSDTHGKLGKSSVEKVRQGTVADPMNFNVKKKKEVR